MIHLPVEEQEKVDEWLLEQLLRAVEGDSRLALNLLVHGADYRDVKKARERGATLEDLERIFC